MGLADDYEWQAGACASLHSPFYEMLLHRIAEELRAGGTLAKVLVPTVRPTTTCTPSGSWAACTVSCSTARHRLRRPLPIHRGDGDAPACWPPLLELLCDPPESLLDSLEQAPQTNEVARAGPLGWRLGRGR